MHIFSFQFCMSASTHATLTQRNGNVFEWGLAATVASKTDSCTELFYSFSSVNCLIHSALVH
jgi:hypothetical protein